MAQSTVQKFDKWHKTRLGHFVTAAIELLLAYVFASLAFNSAHIWEYALAVLFLTGGIQNLVRIFRASKK